MIDVTIENFEQEVIAASMNQPVLVDFWAPWCGPCRVVAPEIAKVAERNAGRLLVVKVNTDVDPAVGAAHRDPDAIAPAGQGPHHMPPEEAGTAENGDKRIGMGLDGHGAGIRQIDGRGVF